MTDKKKQENSHTSLIRNAFMYYDLNTRQYEKEFKKVRYTKLNLSKNDVEQSTIELYGKENMLLKSCTVQILGTYNMKTQTFSWAWSSIFFTKQMTKIARKLFNYGTNIPFIETTETSITNPKYGKALFSNNSQTIHNHTLNVVKGTKQTNVHGVDGFEEINDTVGIMGLKSNLITSNIYISYSAQLDMLLALSMYLSKQTRLYKFSLDGINVYYTVLMDDLPQEN